MQTASALPCLGWHTVLLHGQWQYQAQAPADLTMCGQWPGIEILLS